MLDREGCAGPEDLAMIGSPYELRDRVAELEAAGVTTFAASAFGNESERAATREFMQSLL